MHTFYFTQEATSSVKDNPPDGGDIRPRLILSNLCDQVESKISWEITLENKANSVKSSLLKAELWRMEPEFVLSKAFFSKIVWGIINQVKIFSGHDTFNHASKKTHTDLFDAREIGRSDSGKLTHQLYEDGN